MHIWKFQKICEKKLDFKSEKIIFIGYWSLGYCLLDPVSDNIAISINVKFIEGKKKLCVTVRILEIVLIETDNTSHEIIHDSSDAESINYESLRPKSNIKTLNEYYTYGSLVRSFDPVLF